MLSFIVAVCAALLAVLAIVFRKVYFAIPSKQLKRQAEGGDMVAARLWDAVGLGSALRVFLWLVIVFGSGLSILLLARIAPPVLGLIGVVILLWVAFSWLPNTRPGSIGIRLTADATPLIAWLVSTLQPALDMIYRLTHRKDVHVHTGVYVREDLLELIERQKSQDDNNLTIEELTIAANALQFGDKKVRNVMVPRKEIKAVNADDAISPVYLDELHKTGHSRFPVYEGKRDHIVGTLFLHDLTDIGSGKGVKGQVSAHMQPGVIYVHENDSLAQALHAFYFTKRQLFVVVDSFEAVVGIIALDDIMHALLGVPGEYDFDQHDSKPAVAAKHTKKPKEIHEVIDETTPEAKPEADPETSAVSPESEE
jgi:CBS domain containing-hemolysin-like protein